MKVKFFIKTQVYSREDLVSFQDEINDYLTIHPDSEICFSQTNGNSGYNDVVVMVVSQ